MLVKYMFEISKQKLNNYLTSLKELFVKNKRTLLIFTLVFLIVLDSGYCALSLSPDSKFLTITKILILLFNVVLIVFLFPRSKIKSYFWPRPKATVLLAGLLLLGFFFSMIINGEFKSIVSYVFIIISILNGFIIAILINIDKFYYYFNKILFFLCVFSLSFYIGYFLYRGGFSPLPNLHYGNHFYSNYFFIAFQKTGSSRMQSIFWEPGLFASFLLIGLSFELLYREKINYLYIIVFLVCLVLTFSTFAYLSFVFLILIFLNKKIKNRIFLYIIIGIVVTALLVFLLFSQQILMALANLFPTIFGKFVSTDSSVSFTTRVYSIIVNIRIFILNPFIGKGLVGATEIYNSYLLSDQYKYLMDSQTSTTFSLLAQIGILGLVPLVFIVISFLKNTKLSTLDSILFLFLYVLILNKEPHNSLLFDYVFMFLLVKTYIDKDDSCLIMEPIASDSFVTSIYKGSDSAVLKKGVTFSLISNLLSFVIGFLSIPCYTKYFNNDVVLGAWLAVLSVVGWAANFDFGISSSLKNKLIDSIASNDIKTQKKLISTAYLTTSAIALLVLLVSIPIVSLIDINTFIGAGSDSISPQLLRICIFIALIAVCFQFVLKNITSILQSHQKHHITVFFSLFTTIGIVAFTSIANFKTVSEQLLIISIVYLVASTVPYLVVSISYFTKSLKDVRPNIKFADKDSFSSITKIGLGFFVTQISLLLLNSINSILISSLYGSVSLVDYNKYSKLLTIIYSFYAMITIPFWAMIAKNFAEKNYKAINRLSKKLLIYFGIFSGLSFLLIPFTKAFLDVWLGDATIEVNYWFLIIITTEIVVEMFINCFSSIANGLSKIKYQAIVLLPSAIIKIPLTIFLANSLRDLSWSLIFLINIGLYLPACILMPILTFGFLKKKQKEVIAL